MLASSSDRLSKVIILADDLSGAAELAGIAFTHGLSAEVQREFEPDTNANVVAIDTDSRHLAPSAAADRLLAIATKILATNPAWIYKKVDSVLRGNVRAEIEAILQVTRQPRALLIPANPSRGRIIQSGQYLVDGIALDQTPFARDPQHPRFVSDALTLLGPGAADVSIPDVESESQLERLAAQCDPNIMPAGAADFFSALLSHRAPPNARGRESLSVVDRGSGKATSDNDSRPLSLPISAPALLVCGSPAAWPARRDACLAAGNPVRTINDPLDDSTLGNALLLGIGDTPPESNGTDALQVLAQHAARLISHFNIILAEGGATAAAIAAEMKWKRFQVVATAPAGVGVLQPLVPRAPLFLVKPGSYSWPREIWEAFCRCTRV